MGTLDIPRGEPAEKLEPQGDLVCWSHLRWNFVFQRPQHLMVRWAKSHRVVFFEEPVDHDGAPRLSIRTEPCGVTVVVPQIARSLTGLDRQDALRQLAGSMYDELQLEAPIAWYYSPMFLPVTRELPAGTVVYDCMDELSAFHGAPPELVKLESELLDRAHIVFTGGHSLWEAKRTRHGNVHSLPSSVDVAHFVTARTTDVVPDDQGCIPRPRIGFYGVIDERMDLRLVDGLAALRPEWQIVIIGPVVKIDPATLPQRPNIHYLGMKSYAELPSYLAGWNVAMLPFALNEATRFISPTKTPEYMAGGCPVISTAIRDVVKPYGEAGLVHIANDAAGFSAALDDIELEDPLKRRKAHDEFLRDLSWDRTFDKALELVGEAAVRGVPCTIS